MIEHKNTDNIGSEANINKNEGESESELRKLKKVIDIAFYTLIPFTILYLAIGFLSNSLIIIAVALDYGLSFIVQLFAFKSIRTILKMNTLKFPYGTGKLENFSSLLYGSLVIPTSLFIIFTSIMRFISPPAFISFGIAHIPLIPSLIRSVWLFQWSRRLMKTTGSPLAHSYYINFKICTLFDIGVLIGISCALALVTFGYGVIAYLFDPAISLVLALYMIFCGITMTIGNFKVLIDLPLPEDDQLKIMSVLAQEYESYENVGNIYTRISGKRRFIDIELYLRKDMSVDEIMSLRQRMETNLKKHFRDIHFNLIPLYKKPLPKTK